MVRERDSNSSIGFPVWLSGPSAQTVTVDYTTADNSAKTGGDYASTSGTLTFDPGQTAKVITLSIVGELVYETEESFFVRIGNPLNASVVSDAEALVVIMDDRMSPPSLSMT
ncbi:MAG: hypothetical protein EXR51_07405 [Dehalococcoidia bacterium]|nr:hypothetical protein [Dehalococcoidia bacterium]